MLRQRLGLRALHLDAGQRQRHILSDRFLPVRAGRRIGSQNIVAAIGVVEFDEGGAAIARMQLHAAIGRMPDDVGDAHADLLGMPPARVGIVAAEDRHVATATAGLFEKAPCRGARLERRHHFEQDGIDRQQRVFQAIFGDVTVAVTDAQPHDIGDIGDHGLELRRHEADLPQP